IVFFGHSKLGMDVAARGLKNGKKVILETSGSDATLVWHDADLKKSADDIFNTRFIGSGQFCIATKRVFVHSSVYEELIERLLAKVKNIKNGLPSDPGCEQSPIGKVNIVSHLENIVNEAKDEGASVITGGHVADYTGATSKADIFYQPTILTNVNQRMRVMQEEVFGPVLPITKIDSLPQAVQLINDSSFGLRSSIWSTDKNIVAFFIRNIDAGGIIVNSDHYYTSTHTPHLGGTKFSGITGAKYFSDEMCFNKFVHSP
ncbi:hypothetical protein LCGC14_2460640, partial [marine sediment metagenome]